MNRISPLSRTRLIISILCGVPIAAYISILAWTERGGDDPNAIREVSAVVNQFVQNNSRGSQAEVNAFGDLIPPTWDEVKAATDRLGYPNRGIARARALVVLDRHPEAYSDYEWRDRFEQALLDYKLCSTFKRASTSLGTGALAFVAAVPVAWLLLIVISWIWYFTLDRVLELSAAVRGKDISH